MEGGGDQGGAYRLYTNQGRSFSLAALGHRWRDRFLGKSPMACGRYEEMPKGYCVDNSAEVRGWHYASPAAGTIMQGWLAKKGLL
jgi:hypothetical protein